MDSIQAGSGAQFSLLPPENATGNFVKVVQRVPVKIVFDEPLPADFVIGPGLSVTPSVQVSKFALPKWLIAIAAIMLAGGAVWLFKFLTNRKAGGEVISHAPQEWKPRHSPWLIAMGVMLATFMEVLDTSIANIALPHIAGSLSATPEEATWVLTSYLVANAIVLPTTGWLANHFGRKRVFITCIVLFTLASALCGLAWSLPTLICARILQGVGGGAMVPIAQSIMLESFPRQKRGAAMAIFAQGVVVAPILGPTLGGWITDSYSWRWIFYINLPVGIMAVLAGAMARRGSAVHPAQQVGDD